MSKENKPADLNGLPSSVASLIKSGIPLHKAMSISMMKNKMPTPKKKK